MIICTAELEKIIKEINDGTGNYRQPIIEIIKNLYKKRLYK